MKKVWPMTLVAIFLSGCAYVSGPVYVHEDTDVLRRSIYAARVDGIGERDLVLVPDFRTFVEDFDPRSAHVKILSREPVELAFSKAVFRRPGAGVVKELQLDRTVGVNSEFYESGYYIGYLLLLDLSNSEGLIDSPRIDFDLTYALDGVSVTESFRVELIDRWAWTGPDGGEFR